MRYRLKKDLPFAKAGAEVKIETCNKTSVHYRRDSGSMQYLCGISEFNDLISEGWIEEVKPREWWKICHKELGLFVHDYKTKEEAIRALPKYPHQNLEIIKVREVIE